MLFLLTTFVILVGITIGLWGSVHSAVLQSIAARHYAFEVINNRPHFEYHRDFDGAAPASSGNMFKGPSTMVGFYGKARQMLFVVTVDDPTAVSSKNPIAATRGINFFYEIGRAPSQNPSGLIKSYRANDVNFHTKLLVCGFNARGGCGCKPYMAYDRVRNLSRNGLRRLSLQYLNPLYFERLA